MGDEIVLLTGLFTAFGKGSEEGKCRLRAFAELEVKGNLWAVRYKL